MIAVRSTAIRKLLLAFAQLSRRQRRQFLDALNRFMYASPQRQRRCVEQWENAAQAEISHASSESDPVPDPDSMDQDDHAPERDQDSSP